MANPILDHKRLYRLPWSLPDNGISWLEPTSMCNLACDGCYRENVKNSHKSLKEVIEEIDTFQRLRNSDCISIAGGDPLLYPHILEIVREIKYRGMKPIINTNGKALTMELLKDLKKAGVYGFTFHVDTKQGRGKQWRGKNELELNELRLQYAQMLAEVGGITCSFNSTVYEDTLKYVPGMVEWAQKHIDIVHIMVFITYRHVIPNMPFEWYANGEEVHWNEMHYHTADQRKIDLQSTDVLQKIREKFPDFTPSAYLNGTEKPDSFKWLMTQRVGTKKKIYGYTGPKFMELMMSINHFIKGKYIAYPDTKTAKMGRSILFLSLFDKETRKAAWNLLKNPFNLFRRSYYQSFMFIQPIDFIPEGGANMCDSCPDMTVWNGKLVWSCRLEELKEHGTFLTTVPKKKKQAIPIEMETEAIGHNGSMN